MSIFIVFFTITIFFSTIFAMGGMGSATILVPIFPMLGLGFDESKTLALFVATISMSSASFMNYRRKVLDFRLIIPLVISVLIASPTGAVLSQYTSYIFLQFLLFIFLLLSASLLLFHKNQAKTIYKKTWILYFIGIASGLIGGMVGAGGGSLILPALIALGYDVKKTAYAVGFVIPFSTFTSFLTYSQFVDINWYLLAVISVAALIGGYLGGRIMHYNLSQNQVKKTIGIILYLASFKILYELVA